jgi:hypothetical protein
MIILLERFDESPHTLAPRIVFPEPVVIPQAVLNQTTVFLEPVVLK